MSYDFATGTKLRLDTSTYTVVKKSPAGGFWCIETHSDGTTGPLQLLGPMAIERGLRLAADAKMKTAGRR